jgi:hypothetical protein
MSIVTLNDRAVRSVTTFGSLNTGSMVFIKKLTASSSSTLSFVNGTSDVVLDSTYKEYVFTFKDIHPATDGTKLTFQCSTDGGSNYNTTLTSTYFAPYHNESGSDSALGYSPTNDQAQGTSFQNITSTIGADNDQNCAGFLHLFDPSSTTFVKHYISTINDYANSDYIDNNFTAGYFNTTSAINAIQFKLASGNIDAGDICLYGIL